MSILRSTVNETLLIEMTVRVGEQDRFYKAITKKDIFEALSAYYQRQTIETVRIEDILFERPIKTLGYHVIPYRRGNVVTPFLLFVKG